jgi:Xaa-Pro aminopeptidase
MEKLRGGIVVISAYSSMQRSNDMASPFEQESNFWWLSGIDSPNWWLIIDASRAKSWLVSPAAISINPDRDYLIEAARTSSGVDDILSHDAGMQLLRELSKKYSIVRTLGDQPHGQYLDFSLNPAQKKTYDILDRIFSTVQDCRRELAQLRAIKQPEEIIRIKKATNLVIDGFEYAKQELATTKYEYEIEASLSYYVRRHGGNTRAYDPVVAGGVRACDLQYNANADRLKKRELVVVDSGARVQGYVAGLTRTFTYGEPTVRQRMMHEALVQAHSSIIEHAT